jgi:hypothetical protein
MSERFEWDEELAPEDLLHVSPPGSSRRCLGRRDVGSES